ncbi:hypothetical protein [Pseudothauera rhizosphaerae]|uniref:hypothetical protein n=1 Tax=Pseudothauera rhizosphaerae TaxID=2565932 RepID=UPI001454BF8E|nr:hypothetical protein [Pseudothauera rhizosphaerae]
MKRTDLEKLKGMKINNRLKGTPPPPRFGTSSGGGKAGARVNPLVAKLLGQKPAEGGER